MDPRVALHNWLNGDSTAGGDYSEWTARGGFPVVIEMNPHVKGDRYATVIWVSRNHAHVVFNTSGKRATVKRVDIRRVTLH